jgi:hypothetical protein
MCCNEHHLFGAFARNNLWISVNGGQIWGFDNYTKDWRTDLDADGFDWGAASNPFAYGGVTYPDLSAFAAASGLEWNGLRVSKESCFETFNVPGPPPTPVPPQALTLKPSCAAIDRGAAVPNLADRFTGAAPDLGAYEYGEPPRAYGPRPAPSASLTVWPTSITPGQSATLSWTTSEASSARIDQGIGPVDLSGSMTVMPTSTTTYTLTAVGATGITVSATLNVGAGLLPPVAPAALNAVAASSTRINLTWTDTSDNEVAFSIERSSDAVSFTAIGTVAANVSSYADVNLKQNKTFYYRVRAFNSAVNSTYSNTASARTSHK